MSFAQLLPPPKYTQVEESTDKQKDTSKQIEKPLGTRLNEQSETRTVFPLKDNDVSSEVQSQSSLQKGMRVIETTNSSENRLSGSTDVQGSEFRTLVTQDMRKGQIVYTEFKDLVPKSFTDEELSRPSLQTVDKTIEETKKALFPSKDVSKPVPKYFRYVPPQSSQTTSQKIIRVEDLPEDPLEPPRFRHKKMPQRPPSPPVPVLRSPPRKATKEQVRDWAVPPCVSNWKNIRGYTVPEDHRANAQLEGTQVSERFASLSESLYNAERTARSVLAEKSKIRQQIALKQKEAREVELRELARKARAARNGDDRRICDSIERGQVRRELERDRKRKDRMEHSGRNRDREVYRDLSEKVDLGQGPSSASKHSESLYDQRLFNQSQGLSSGTIADDTYNIYDKPLFEGKRGTYKPRKLADGSSTGDDIEKILMNAKDRFQESKDHL